MPLLLQTIKKPVKATICPFSPFILFRETHIDGHFSCKVGGNGGDCYSARKHGSCLRALLLGFAVQDQDKKKIKLKLKFKLAQPIKESA